MPSEKDKMELTYSCTNLDQIHRRAQNMQRFRITYDELFAEVVYHGVLWYGDGQGAFLGVVDGCAGAALFTGLQPLRLLYRVTHGRS